MDDAIHQTQQPGMTAKVTSSALGSSASHRNRDDRADGLLILTTVTAVWVLAVATLLVGGWLKLGSTLNVWFSGQDLDWYLILRQGVGLPAAQQEFSIDARNPLSGWVYSLLSPIILSSPSGFYLVHLLACLFLGLSVAVMTWQLGRRQSVTLPTCLGSVVALFWFWSYVQQIMSLMLIVYGLSALSVFCFCAYLDSERSSSRYYAWSIVLWLLALGSYSIQSGAIIAFAALSFGRARRRSPIASLQGVWRVASDVAPHAVVGAIFAMLWATSATSFFADPSVNKSTHLMISPSQFVRSVQYLVWHPDFTNMVASMTRRWSAASIFTYEAAAALVVLTILLTSVTRRRDEERTFEAGLWLVIVSLAIATPTILLESSSPIWGPGLRSEMLYSAFTPSLILGVVAATTSFVARAWRKQILCIAAAILGGCVFLASLEQNSDGRLMSAWLKALADGLKPIAEASPKPIHFIVLNTSGLDYIPKEFGDRFVQAALDRAAPRWSNRSSPSETTLRILEKKTTGADCAATCDLTFGDDAEGIRGALFDSDAPVPYSQTSVVRFDGHSVDALRPVQPSDVSGYSIDWHRTEPARGVPVSLIGQRIDFSGGGDWRHFAGSGWVPTSDGPFTWTEGPEARLELPLPPMVHGAELTFDIFPYLAPAIPKRTVTVMVGGKDVATWTFDASVWTTRTISVPPHADAATLQLDLRESETRSPKDLGLSEDPRHLGIAVRSIGVSETP